MRIADYLSLSMRSLRRAKLRSALTIFAIVIGSTGITVMLTFVTTVKEVTVASFVQTGQILQIQVAEQTNLSYDPSGVSGGGKGAESSGSGAPTTPLYPEFKNTISKLPHVAKIAGSIRSRMPALSNIEYAGKRWLIQSVVGYEPNGAITPALAAGRDLKETDTNQILISPSYGKVMGFSKDYSKMIGLKVKLQTMNGYTGIGATLPTTLPPQKQCPSQAKNCMQGPTSGLPAMTITATIVGVIDPANGGDQPVIMLPMKTFIGIYNQSTPASVSYSKPMSGGGCQPGQQCASGQQGQQGQQGGPQVNSSPGIVRGGWVQTSPAVYIKSLGGYDSLMVKADALENVASLATTIERLGVYTATGLVALNEQKTQANTIGLVLGALGFVALFIAALGVMNTMIMSVLQRTREIGVMRAMGARRKTIRRIFTLEATAIGFLGGFIGVLFGYIAILLAKPMITGMVKTGSLTGATFSVPVWLMALVIAGTSAIGFASGFFPALRASNLDPVEALRYE
ncbi:unannotated protein [freshwater metagenome]|uniref:Unannotated protein n=1 Tax=freshwater metagenome TaxID=449393 RepID=A0A6J7XY64_9ZZZZ|nr:FtsX-like permease family protein [Actinomycetota bacterium]